MTPERFRRLKRALDRRQPDLTVLLDNVHKPHNLSAILRNCDAVGIFAVHAVWPSETLRPSHLTSAGAGKWVEIRTHPAVDEAVARLAGDGFRLVAVHPDDAARDYRSFDYTGPTAIELAEARVQVPMMGLGKSLNVSVAAGVVLFEAQRQRAAAGQLEHRRLDDDTYRRVLLEWAHPSIAAYCERHRIAYPHLDENGEIRDPDWRRRSVES